MVSTAIAADVTTAIRGLGTEVETHGRALGATMRHLVGSAGVTEGARRRIAREISVPPTQLLNWIALTLRAAAPLLGESSEAAGTAIRPRSDVSLVDRCLTRC